MRNAHSSWVLLFGVVMLATLSPSRAWAVCTGPAPFVGPECRCGSTVQGPGVTVLTSADPVVRGCRANVPNALIVQGAPGGTTLDLGGTTITGTNKVGVGLLLRGSSITVINGRVRNFDVGIKSDGANENVFLGSVTENLIVTNNRTGIEVFLQDFEMTNVTVDRNLGDGFRGQVSSANGVSFVGNTCSKNGGRGLVVMEIIGAGGGPTLIDDNRCELNGSHGILVVNGSHGYEITRNFTRSNHGTGLLAVGNNSAFRDNQARTNDGDGVRGIGTGLSSNGNNFGTGNGGANCQISPPGDHFC
jgi:hypothetical protein